MAKEYDVAILGGGTGGYVAAIRAAQLGMQVAVIEKDKLGGTCLHKGCIPSKAMLKSAEVFRQTKVADTFGIDLKQPKLNLTNVQKRKTAIIKKLHQGVHALMKKHKIDVFKGTGTILGPSIFSPMPGTISIAHDNGEENTMIVPKNVLIATGSKAKTLGIKIDHKYVLTSDEALEMEQLPETMIIIGGGAIGIEWASMLADFGVRVTVLEYAEQILPTEDKDIANEVEKQLQDKGVTFIKNAQVLPDTLKKEHGVTITAKIKDDEKSFQAERLLISTGREPNSSQIGLQNTSVVVHQGFIHVNEYYQTKESHIYAIGDVIGGMQLAHVASQEGIIAVEHMAGKDPLTINHENIPSCIYSDPEVASIGLTEEEARDKGFVIKVGQFPFQAIGKAVVDGDESGFVKIISNQKNNDLLGIHMVGPDVTNMISEASLAKFLDGTPWEISKTIHPHPSLSEIFSEAALAVDGIEIHR